MSSITSDGTSGDGLSLKEWLARLDVKVEAIANKVTDLEMRLGNREAIGKAVAASVGFVVAAGELAVAIVEATHR